MARRSYLFRYGSDIRLSLVIGNANNRPSFDDIRAEDRKYYEKIDMAPLVRIAALISCGLGFSAYEADSNASFD
jgi:hypothetical protein